MARRDEFKIIEPGERCRHLRSKGLYVNAGLPPGEEIVGDGGDFWCAHNLTTYGPDSRICDGETCCDMSRNCWEAT